MTLGSVRRLAALLRLLALPAAAAVLGWAAQTPWAAVRRPGPASVDDLVALVAAGGAAALLAGLAAATAATLLAAATGRGERAWARLAGRLTPAVLRRLGEVALGLVLVGAPAATLVVPAAAATAPAAASAPALPGVDRPAPHTELLPPRPAQGWLPERPTAARRSTPPPVRLVAAAPRLDRARRTAVVVRRGDSLWRIVARHLGPGTSPATVAAEWPRWYAANRAVIGPDPALLQPGQQLRPPSPDTH